MEIYFLQDGNLFSKDGNLFSKDGNLFSKDGNLFSKDGNLFSKDLKINVIYIQNKINYSKLCHTFCKMDINNTNFPVAIINKFKKKEKDYNSQGKAFFKISSIFS